MRIFFDEAVDDAAAEPALIIEHVMCDAEPVGDGARVVDILPRATGARTPHSLAMIVELERHANDLSPGPRRERSRDGAVDAA